MNDDVIAKLFGELVREQTMQIMQAAGVDLDQERRIRACIQACEGITTEALEAGFVEYCIEEVFDKYELLFYQCKAEPITKANAKFRGVKIWE